MSLSSKQQLFINEYLKCWNATEAARLAGYSGNNVTLASVGYENLRKPQIAEVINLRFRESAMSADEVLKRLADMARGDIAEFSEVNRRADLTKEELKGKTHIVRKVKHSLVRGRDGTEYENTELELYDAQSALIHIGKHHGLFTDKIEVKLAKEVELVLEVIEGVLDADSYQRVLQAIVGSGEGGSEETESDSEL